MKISQKNQHALLLAIITTIIFTCCSGRTEYTYTPKPPVEALEHLEIAVFGHTSDPHNTNIFDLWDESSWYTEIIEQAFNVDLTFRVHGVRESDTAIWVSKYTDNIGDAAFLYMEPPLGYIGGDADKLIEIGATREIPKAMITRHMPGYTAYLNERIENGWQIMGPTDEDETAYASLISVDLYRAVPLDGIAVYADWFESAGIDVDTSKNRRRLIMESPDTYWVDSSIDVDQFEQLLKYLKESDPDGNGQNDTIPWPAKNTHDDRWWSAGLRGITGRISGPIVENGTVTYGEISDNFKSYCRQLQVWYEKGLIDVYFGMDNWQRYIEKYTAGNMGASPFTTKGSFPLYSSNEANRSCLLRLAGDEKTPGDILVFPPVVGEDGKNGVYGSNSITGYRFVVSNFVEDEKLERLLQIWEFLNFSTDEEYILARYGRPGTDFSWTGEAWNSRPKSVSKKKVANRDDEKDLGKVPMLLPHGWDRRDFYLRFPTGLADLLMERLTDETIIKNAWFDDYLLSTGSGLLADLEREYTFRLSNLTFGYMGEVIRDGRDIDSTWDEYVRSWLYMGGSKLVDAARNDRSWQPETTGFMPIY